MSITSNINSHIIEIKKKLTEGRAKLKNRHEEGMLGVQTCNALSKLFDETVIGIYQEALKGFEPEVTQNIALVAHGGYGRQDVAPFSDVDIMLLYKVSDQEKIAPLAGKLLRDIGDTGLIVGHSVRTPKEAVKLGLEDAQILTSLSESRLLAGNEAIFKEFFSGFSQKVQLRSRKLFQNIEQARREERSQHGEVSHLLEPNIKRSPGGLREIQLLRWVAFLRFGKTDFESLRLCGALSADDFKLIREAYGFLLRVRNEVHFNANRSKDVLERQEQLRIANEFGFSTEGPLLPVERFMREYFRHTDNVRIVVRRFRENTRPNPLVYSFTKYAISHQVEGDFRVGPREIWATKSGMQKITKSLEEVVRLAELANLYGKEISHHTTDAIRKAASDIPAIITPSLSERFVSLMDHPAKLSKLLFELHDIGVLEKLIPDMAHARCLVQFNEYHKYTIDEHSIIAVRKLCEFYDDPGLLGDIYRSIKKKYVLHLAMLLHDLGKGFEEDHSEVGKRIAERISVRFGLSDEDAEMVVFLVHQHLKMSHLAFWRDISDDQVMIKFAIEVGSPEALQMLFLLTVADTMAVGPDVWNDWKHDILFNLYTRANGYLSGNQRAVSNEERLNVIRYDIKQFLAEDYDHWYEQQVEYLTPSFSYGTKAPYIAEILKNLRELEKGKAYTRSQYIEESDTTEYIFGSHEKTSPGVLHKLVGALSEKGVTILSADVNSLSHGLILDRFLVEDPMHSGCPPEERQESIKLALEKVLTDDYKAPKLVAKKRYGQSQSHPELTLMPTKVKIDNNTSENFTIIDVFASDRFGLLYHICHKIHELGLDVSYAKIGTHLDQIVDVFYVTDNNGKKIEDSQRTKEIKNLLLNYIKEFEEALEGAGA